MIHPETRNEEMLMNRLFRCVLTLCLTAAILSGCLPAGQPATQPAQTAAPSVDSEPTASLPTVAPTSAPTAAPTTAPTTPPATESAPVTVPTETAPPPETTLPPETVPVPQMPESVTPQNITAGKAFLYHCGTGRYLYIKGDLDETLYPASIAKLMTAYVTLQFLKPDQTVTAGDALDDVAKDTSHISLKKGDTLTVGDLLKGMLITSGCDAAYVLAEAAGKVITGDPEMPAQRTVAAFVARMNQQAELLGLVNTHFVNPDGYHDEQQYSCMADLTTLAALVMEEPLIRDICATEKTQIQIGDRTMELINSNHLLTQHPQNPYFFPEANGLKTGTTQAAGHCLMATFQIGDTTLLAGIFLCKDDAERLENAIRLADAWKQAVAQIPA